MASSRHATIRLVLAGVTQLVECLLPKQVVVGSSPIARSTLLDTNVPSHYTSVAFSMEIESGLETVLETVRY